jgi:hypothetical protein
MMSAPCRPAVATLLGNPAYWGSPNRNRTSEQLASLPAASRPAHFDAFPETAGILFYTVDELAAVCNGADDCPRCHGVPRHERLPGFLGFLRETLEALKPGAEMWWEPWEFSAAQTYAMAERLDRA